jgi:hypothetical protein
LSSAGARTASNGTSTMRLTILILVLAAMLAADFLPMLADLF